MDEQTALLESPTKRCASCEKELAVLEFGVNRGKKDGLQSYCRQCSRKYARQYCRRKRQKAARKVVGLASRYGITREFAEALLQVPCCQACGDSIAEHGSERIDHCHQLSHVRGVLCHKCNLACAGPQMECIDRLRGCVSYLERDLERLAMETECPSTNRSEFSSKTGLSCIAAALSAGGPSPTADAPSRFTTSSKDSTGTRLTTPNAISACAIAAMTCCMTAALLAIFRT